MIAHRAAKRNRKIGFPFFNKSRIERHTIRKPETLRLAKSPASALRLQQGDVITAVNGKSVKNLKEFYAELSKVEKSVNFDVYSNGGTITTGTYKF